MLALVTGSLVYCVLTILAAIRYRAVRPPELRSETPISVLKPLAGVDDGLEDNLRSFFEQKYAEFEILFAVRNADDPAIAVAERLRARYPAVPSRMIVTGEPPYPNAKVYSLDLMLAAARHDLLVMADSDIRVTPTMLATIAAEFQDPKLGLATCPYRAVPGRSFWNTLEAIGLNTEFIGGVLVARMLDGMKFALGPTIAARRATLAGIGGFAAVKDFLAEDFVMGKLAAESGDGVIVSSSVNEHRIGAQTLAAKHRLRWNRSTQRSRPAGYEVLFTIHCRWLLLWVASRMVAGGGGDGARTLRAARRDGRPRTSAPDKLTRVCFSGAPGPAYQLPPWLGGFFEYDSVARAVLPYKADGRFELVVLPPQAGPQMLTIVHDESPR